MWCVQVHAWEEIILITLLIRLRADCMRCRKQSCGRGNDGDDGDDGGSGKSGDVVTMIILH